MESPRTTGAKRVPDTQLHYNFAFSPGTPYGHAFELLRQQFPVAAGLVIDLGCGQAAIAGPLIQLGFEYVGLDSDPDSVAAVRAGGIDVRLGDLAESPRLTEVLLDLAAGRSVAAVLMLDVIEHLPRTRDLLDALRTALSRLGDPVLVVSIPNIAHFDVGARLIMGQFEMTPTGLLDETHISFFTDQRLADVFSRSGFHETARNDFRLAHSDQHVPASHPALASGTPMSQYLRELRRLGGDTQDVNQFIRLYQPGPALPEPTDVVGDVGAQSEPSLTVLLRTQGRRLGQLEEALTCLAAQTVQDLEVIILAHSVDSPIIALIRRLVRSYALGFRERIQVVPVDGGGLRGRPLNIGLSRARGRAIAFLDDDDLVTADWAETFVATLNRHPGQVARSVCLAQTIIEVSASQGSYRTIAKASPHYPERFDSVRQVVENTTPFCSFAVDRVAVEVLGLTFDETLPVLEDWDFLMRAALPSGVIDSSRPTSIYHHWSQGSNSSNEPEAVWTNARMAVTLKLDDKPLLLPRGSASLLHRAGQGQASLQDSAELTAEMLRLRDAYQNWKLLAELREAEIARLTRIERQPIVRALLGIRKFFKRAR